MSDCCQGTPVAVTAVVIVIVVAGSTVVVVSFLVLGQVVTSHEALATMTFKTFLTCVRTIVALKLIRSCKSLSTICIFTNKWPLSTMPAKVGPQVRRLAVDSIATFIERLKELRIHSNNTHMHARTHTHTRRSDGS